MLTNVSVAEVAPEKAVLPNALPKVSQKKRVVEKIAQEELIYSRRARLADSLVEQKNEQKVAGQKLLEEKIEPEEVAYPVVEVPVKKQSAVFISCNRNKCTRK